MEFVHHHAEAGFVLGFEGIKEFGFGAVVCASSCASCMKKICLVYTPGEESGKSGGLCLKMNLEFIKVIIVF